MREVVVGDVHGCLEELDALLAELAPRPGDRLFFLGDLVDRGPDSVGVVRRVREVLQRHTGSLCVAGNHEEKVLRRREKGGELPAWAADASEEDWRFLEGLPLYHQLPGRGVVLVHGGFYPKFFERNVSLPPVPSTWRTDRGKTADRLRRFLRVRCVSPVGDAVALGETGPLDRHWTEVYDGRAGFCLFGHDPQLDPPEPLHAPHALGLDTGCCFGGRLTAAVAEERGSLREPTFLSVPARAQYAHRRLVHEEREEGERPQA